MTPLVVLGAMTKYGNQPYNVCVVNFLTFEVLNVKKMVQKSRFLNM